MNESRRYAAECNDRIHYPLPLPVNLGRAVPSPTRVGRLVIDAGLMHLLPAITAILYHWRFYYPWSSLTLTDAVITAWSITGALTLVWAGKDIRNRLRRKALWTAVAAISVLIGMICVGIRFLVVIIAANRGGLSQPIPLLYLIMAAYLPLGAYTLVQIWRLHNWAAKGLHFK